MASEAEINEVRLNTGLASDDTTYTDEYVGGLVDAVGISAASLAIWKQKAASYAGLVDVTEAGASHKFSDKFAHADSMIKRWTSIVDGESTTTSSAPRVNSIVRE